MTSTTKRAARSGARQGGAVTATRPAAASHEAKPPAARGAQRGIQSVEVGGRLLTALAHAGRPLPLKDLAAAAQMAAAKAHPYLVSYGKLGLVVQDESTGRYGLGPLALQLGLISLQQFDPVRLATPLLRELSQQLGHTTAIGVWGNRGATMVRIEEAPSAVHVSMRHGTVVSLRGTASGKLFAAHLPREVVLAAMRDELAAESIARGQAVPATLRAKIEPAFEAELAEIRETGVARVVDGAVVGVSALAAPVFDQAGRLVLSFTAIGPSAVFDVRLDGPVAAGLKSAARKVSLQLGAPSS